MKINNTPSSIWRKPLHFIAFGFGAGASPCIPGTIGTLVGILFFLTLSHLTWIYYVMAVLLLTLVSVFITHQVSKEIGVHDHSGITLDEIVGFLITMIAIPATWGWIFSGFLLFRLFDIWKPFPIRKIDKQVSGGLGIVLDDVLAGVYANIVLHMLLLLWNH